jgi:hypothetical protein
LIRNSEEVFLLSPGDALWVKMIRVGNSSDEKGTQQRCLKANETLLFQVHPLPLPEGPGTDNCGWGDEKEAEKRCFVV